MYKVFLLGGVGNNLFQIARAKSLAQVNQKATLLKISKKHVWIYKLISRHKIHEDWLDVDKLAAKLDLEIAETNLLDLIRLGKIFIQKKLGIKTVFNRPLSEISSDKGIFKKSKIEVGYFQTTNHVSTLSVYETSVALKIILNVRLLEYEKLILHLRGGDFSIDSRISYSDIEKAKSICYEKKLEFEIVTDDIKYTQMCLKSLDIKASIRSSDPRNDFMKMCCSNSLYLSNSTFSLWASNVARLNGANNVYLPNNWSYTSFFEQLEVKSS